MSGVEGRLLEGWCDGHRSVVFGGVLFGCDGHTIKDMDMQMGELVAERGWDGMGKWYIIAKVMMLVHGVMVRRQWRSEECLAGGVIVRNDGAACKLTSPPLPRWSEALRQLWTS